jgi:hypothetical protein
MFLKERKIQDEFPRMMLQKPLKLNMIRINKGLGIGMSIREPIHTDIVSTK